jgi:hypothetical protein
MACSWPTKKLRSRQAISLYPALRPFSDEASLEGAAAFASTGWLVAHMLAVVAFTLLFYGAETFGLQAIGQEAVRQQNVALLDLAAAVRSGVGLVIFVVGLLLLAVAGVLAAVAIWKSGIHLKWSGFPFAIGILLYIPQFFWTQPLRVAQGLLVAIGCIWIAAVLWRRQLSPPTIQYPVYLAFYQGARFQPLIAVRQELVVTGLSVADMGDDGQPDGLFIQDSGGRRASNAAAVLLAGVFGNDDFSSRWAGGVELANPRRKTLLVLLVLFHPTLGLPLSAAGARLAVDQAFLFGLFQSLFFD